MLFPLFLYIFINTIVLGLVAVAAPQYFEDNKLNPKGVWPGIWRMALVFACAMLTFLATYGFWPAVPLAVRFVTAAIFGCCQVNKDTLGGWVCGAIRQEIEAYCRLVGIFA